MNIRPLVTLVCAIAVLDVSAAEFATCNPDGAQLELNACAADDFAAADKELNEVYRSLLKKEEHNRAFVNKLRAAQRAWLEFRDAELEIRFACEEPDPRICWGSMYPMCHAYYKARLTRDRTRSLRALLEGQEGGC